ncbi:hypothetical protein KBD45_03295 [Candidatus Dojkabacteria bacterium]|nr:hypothetical protein [Candidatus Dojkabacteria bacterium]
MQRIIDEIKQHLVTDYFDVYHDIGHHYSVWSNGIEIAQSEKLTYDYKIFELSAWLHDTDKGNETQNFLKSLALKYSELSEIFLKVENVIAEHSFGQTQTTVESKLLYDADKIELVSLPRWQNAFNQYEENLITIEQRDKYVSEWNRRMPLLKGNLHFNESNAMFETKYSKFIIWLEAIGRWHDGIFT